MSKSRVVTIGGGTGAPIIIQALIEAGVDNITAISAAMDSGGDARVPLKPMSGGE